MVKGFREFILRGDVVDLAVAVVIGVAFGAVVTSFVDNILTPLIGIFGVGNFESLTINVGSAQLKYGLFIQAVLSFLFIALAIFFLVVKPLNALAARRKTETAVVETTKECPECLSKIPLAAKRCAFCTSVQP